MKQWEILAYVVCFSIVLRGGITSEMKTQASIVWDLVVFAWSLGFVNLVYLGGALNYFGVRPGTSIGLLGILFKAFLHADWVHLMSNTLPFIILGWLVMLQGTTTFYIVTIFTALVNGIGLWLFGRPNATYIGASGVIFGYLGFLLAHGYFAADWLSITVSIAVCFLYGRSLRQALPGLEGLSWEGHLFGFIAGLLAARFLAVLKVMFPLLSHWLFVGGQ